MGRWWTLGGGWGALRHRGFRRIWIANGVSGLGSSLSDLALPLLVLTVTGSATWAGVVGTARLVFLMAAQLPAGVIADRFDRRVLLIATDLGCALVAATLMLFALMPGAIAAPVLIAVVAAEGMMAAVAGCCGQAAMPKLVPGDDIADAIALSQVQYRLTRLAGPPLGGALFIVHPALPFVLDALSYVYSAALIAVSRMDLGGRVREAGGSVLSDLRAGLAYIRRDAFLPRYLGWTSLNNFASAAIGFGVVIGFGAGRPEQLGLATSAIAVAGLLGAFAARATGRMHGRRVVVAGSVCWIAAAVLAAVVPAAWPIAAAMMIVSLVAPSVTIPYGARIARGVPNELMGRVQGGMMLIGGAFYPFAALAVGATTDLVSLRAAMIGSAVILAGALLLSFVPAMRLAPAADARGADPEAAQAAGR